MPAQRARVGNIIVDWQIDSTSGGCAPRRGDGGDLLVCCAETQTAGAAGAAVTGARHSVEIYTFPCSSVSIRDGRADRPESCGRHGGHRGAR
jgi:hypothetical protein